MFVFLCLLNFLFVMTSYAKQSIRPCFLSQVGQYRRPQPDPNGDSDDDDDYDYDLEPALEFDRCQDIVSHVQQFEIHISKFFYDPEEFPEMARSTEVDLNPLLAGSRLEKVTNGNPYDSCKIVHSHIGMD